MGSWWHLAPWASLPNAVGGRIALATVAALHSFGHGRSSALHTAAGKTPPCCFRHDTSPLLIVRQQGIGDTLAVYHVVGTPQACSRRYLRLQP